MSKLADKIEYCALWLIGMLLVIIYRCLEWCLDGLDWLLIRIEAQLVEGNYDDKDSDDSAGA